MKIKIGIIIFFIGLNIWAQVQVGIGTNTPNLSSILDITSINKGILIPRAPIANITLQAIIGVPSKGLLVWHTSTTKVLVFIIGMD